jgi:uncharacterized protein (TIGR03435 family)
MDPEDNHEYETLLRQFQPRKPALPAGMSSSPRQSSVFRSVAIAIAAVLALAVSLVVYRALVYPVGPPQFLKTSDRAVLRADASVGTVVLLPDGSVVEMRPKSEMSFDDGLDGVRIRLNRGSVIVTAAKQHAGHLVVETRDVVVTVTGTIFLVSAEETGSRVAVIQGEVQVARDARTTKLMPGEQLSTNPAVGVVPIAEEIAWSQNAAAHLELLRRRRPVVPQQVPLEFAATSIKVVAPGTKIAGNALGIACRGTDGTQRVIVLVVNVPGQPANSFAPEVNAPQGRCVANGVFLSTLIELAYGTPLRFVSGWPEWAQQKNGSPSIVNSGTFTFPRSVAFQIEAAADDPASVTLGQLRQMLQTMLADRFKLKVRREKREAPGYALVVAKNGSRMKKVNDEPDSWLFLGQAKSTMPQLAQRLVGVIDAPVVDRTGLDGVYEYQLRLPPRGGQRGGDGPPAGDLSDRTADVFVAIESQLGLRLQPVKAVPIELVVIDQVEMPTPN